MIKTTQTCDRCGFSRTMEKDMSQQAGGWRVFEGIEICPNCVADTMIFLATRIDGSSND